MSLRKPTLGTLTCLTAIALAGMTAPAQAGFEWRGPLAPPAPAQAATPAPATSAGEMTGLEPVIEWNSAAPVSSMPAQKVEDVHAMPIDMISVPHTVVTEPAPVATPVAAPQDMGEVISGFGSDLPLVIALQQVVPPGYQFSFASGVNPGSSVSWSGGAPWKEVLANMLSAQGLGYRVSNNTVVVGYFASESTPAPASPARVLLNSRSEAPAYEPSVRTEELPMNLAAPAMTGAPASNADEPVYIRREKPSSLLKKAAGAESSATPAVVDAVPAKPLVLEQSAALSARPAAAPAAVLETAPALAPAMPQWQGAKGQTLRDVLKNWSDTAGVELYWSIDYDYRLEKDAAISGNYDEAVGKLLDLFAAVRPQPYGQLHQGSHGARVLVIKSYDLTH